MFCPRIGVLKNETTFEITACSKGRVGLNISVSQIYSNFLKKVNVVKLSDPPYSPDLSPCDFFMLPLQEETLFGRRCEFRNVFGSAIYQYLQCTPKKACFTAFTELISRLEKCVSVKGNTSKG